MIKGPVIYFLTLLFAFSLSNSYAQDSALLLKKITVRGVKQRNSFNTAIPSQALNKETLQQINAPSAGDAARFFSGVQVKDYGGAGGLKTISIRSLGASQTAILYDGISIADVQSGQVDLSRYSSTFIQSIDLYQANLPGSLLPARTFSSASVLAINTQSYTRNTWQAGIRSGSFGYGQAFAGAGFVLPSNITLGANVEMISSDGNYPVIIENGNILEKTKRNNGAIKSLQAELNLSKTFDDSSNLQLKGWVFDSKRGLPGAIVFFNDRSVQQVWNQDYFFQGKYKKSLTPSTSFIILGKFNHNYTRYRDPDFLNNTGGLDDRYQQTENYLSGAINRRVGRYFSAGFAGDIAYATLKANKTRFPEPSRFSSWNNLLLNYDDSTWSWNASLLYSRFSDKLVSGTEASVKNKFTPTVSLSRRLSANGPFLLRAFYKHVFRMPTFNDLYYNFIGNTRLRPESASQYNLGISYSKYFNQRFKQINFSADAYYNAVTDKIVAVPAQNLFSWSMLNLGEVDIKGIDLAADANGSFHSQLNWFMRLAYTVQQARDLTDPTSINYKDRIPYTPDHSGSGIFSLSYKKWAAGYSMVFSGNRYTLGENNPFNQLPGWGIQDLFLSHGITFHDFKISLKGEINNIGDERYDVIRFYPMPGRSYKISILFGNL